jgi:hypothetical protein
VKGVEGFEHSCGDELHGRDNHYSLAAPSTYRMQRRGDAGL